LFSTWLVHIIDLFEIINFGWAIHLVAGISHFNNRSTVPSILRENLSVKSDETTLVIICWNRENQQVTRQKRIQFTLNPFFAELSQRLVRCRRET